MEEKNEREREIDEKELIMDIEDRIRNPLNEKSNEPPSPSPSAQSGADCIV